MAKAYRSSVNWADEEYSFFERIHSKNKARRVSEKAAKASGRELAKFNREFARRNKELRLGISMPAETLACNMTAAEFFGKDPEPRYAA